jgi:hypothetical protein
MKQVCISDKKHTHTQNKEITDAKKDMLHKNKQYHIIIRLFFDMLPNLIEFDEGWSLSIICALNL